MSGPLIFPSYRKTYSIKIVTLIGLLKLDSCSVVKEQVCSTWAGAVMTSSPNNQNHVLSLFHLNPFYLGPLSQALGPLGT